MILQTKMVLTPTPCYTTRHISLHFWYFYMISKEYSLDLRLMRKSIAAVIDSVVIYTSRISTAWMVISWADFSKLLRVKNISGFYEIFHHQCSWISPPQSNNTRLLLKLNKLPIQFFYLYVPQITTKFILCTDFLFYLIFIQRSDPSVTCINKIQTLNLQNLIQPFRKKTQRICTCRNNHLYSMTVNGIKNLIIICRVILQVLQCAECDKNLCDVTYKTFSYQRIMSSTTKDI